MNLLVDESVDRQIVDRLRLEGHDVIYIAEIEPSITDSAVFDRANASNAILLTADKDFGEIVFRDGRLISDGVILIRLSGLSADKKSELVASTLSEYDGKFAKKFCVIAPGKVRITSKDHRD